MSKGMWLLITGGVILTIGDIIQKQWAITGKTWMFWLAILVWAISSIFLAVTYKYKNMAVATTIYLMVNIVLITLISWFWYGEKLTPVQMFALVLAMTAMVLLE